MYIKGDILCYVLNITVCSFICQVDSAKRQRRNLCRLRVKLPPVTTITLYSS